MKKIGCSILLFLIAIISLPLLFYAVDDLAIWWHETRINDEFVIGKYEAHQGYTLRNENQFFVWELTKVYWNQDSLVASGKNGCYLIIFGETKYNDQKIELQCWEIEAILKNKPIQKWYPED